MSKENHLQSVTFTIVSVGCEDPISTKLEDLIPPRWNSFKSFDELKSLLNRHGYEMESPEVKTEEQLASLIVGYIRVYKDGKYYALLTFQTSLNLLG